MADFGPKYPLSSIPKGKNPSRPIDTVNHGVTRMRGHSGPGVSDTTIFVFRDPRKTKVSIYRGFEGLPWALTDLVRKTNEVIARGDVPGQMLSEGDVIQACVVSYYDGEVHKPQTTDDSPRYATLPYRLVRAAEGHMSAEPAIPPETALHFNIPVTVGDLIPNLSEEMKTQVKVSLQLKEAAHRSDRAIQAGIEEAVQAREAQYDVSEQADMEATAFLTQLTSMGQEEATPVNPMPILGEAPADESARLRSKISERLKNRSEDTFDFGFSDD